MRLYKMELSKILSRRFTWIISGLWITAIAFMLLEEKRVSAMVIDRFGQISSYQRFLYLEQTLVLCTMVWLTLILSPLYCEDRQNKMDALLLTSVKGKLSDFVARLGVVFTLIAGSFIFTFLLAAIMCYILYGYSGNNYAAADACFVPIEFAAVLADIDIFSYNMYYLMKVLCGVIMMMGIIVWISAASTKTVNSLIAGAVVFWCPLMMGKFSGFTYGSMAYKVWTGQPIFLIMEKYLWFNWSIYRWHIFLACFVAVAGIICAGRRWCHTK